jgi:hypothetical protein
MRKIGNFLAVCVGEDKLFKKRQSRLQTAIPSNQSAIQLSMLTKKGSPCLLSMN